MADGSHTTWPEWLGKELRCCVGCQKKLSHKTGWHGHAPTVKGRIVGAYATCLSCIGAKPRKFEEIRA